MRWKGREKRERRVRVIGREGMREERVKEGEREREGKRERESEKLQK